MKAGGKDRPPMLAPDNYVQWKSRIKRYIDTKPNHELIHFCLKNPPYQYKFKSNYADTTPTTPGNDVADDDSSSKEKKIDKLMALISISFNKIYKTTNNNLRASSNTRNTNVDNAIRSNKGTGHVARECKEVKRPKNFTYHKEKMLLCKKEEAGIQLRVEQADWRDDTDDEPEDQELKVHYMYMTLIQEVIPDAVINSGPIFDVESLQMVHNSDDDYNVFANERQHPEQPESINDTYLVEQSS
nr:hypothetical protein [Tanacetum cinerariifolium]